MWFKRKPAVAWRNPCGAVTLTPEVYRLYRAVFDTWQRQWYERWPDVDHDPRWYARANPEPALGYPPGFLKRRLDVFVIYTASSPDTDGYFWANERLVTGVDSYHALDIALKRIPAAVEMLILSGERLNVSGECCGVCWREYNEVGFSSAMPDQTARLLRARIRATGLFVLGSCHAGNDPALVQEMADIIGRPVAGARGVCRGVRTQLLAENGIPWTLGGYADGHAYTLAEPAAGGGTGGERSPRCAGR
jgi:hypothetical protein